MISIREGWCGVFAPVIRIRNLILHEDRIIMVTQSGGRVDLKYSDVSDVDTWSSLLAVQLCLQVTDGQGSVYRYRLITWAWRSAEIDQVATIITWEISQGWRQAQLVYQSCSGTKYISRSDLERIRRSIRELPYGPDFEPVLRLNLPERQAKVSTAISEYPF